MDGRGCEDYRCVEVETDVVSNTSGSARVKLVSAGPMVCTDVDVEEWVSSRDPASLDFQGAFCSRGNIRLTANSGRGSCCRSEGPLSFSKGPFSSPSTDPKRVPRRCVSGRRGRGWVAGCPP